MRTAVGDYALHPAVRRWLRPAVIMIVAALLGTVPASLSVAASPPSQKASDQQKARRKALTVEFTNVYSLWLREVAYIITPEERAAFKRLTTDDEREQFIEQFWERRNPEPGSPENKFREEYYRRIVFANQRFSNTVPGWKTDRGRIYILYGPPDEIDSQPTGGTMRWSVDEGPPGIKTFPFEQWFYRYLKGAEGVEENQVLTFVDPTNAGEYRLTINPADKDVLLHVPMHNLHPEADVGPFLKPFSPAASLKFPDLRAIIASKPVLQNPLPLLLHTFHFPATGLTGLTLVTIQVANRDLQFQNSGEAEHASVEVYCQIETPFGRIVSVFENTFHVDLPLQDREEQINGRSVLEQSVPLRPGLYKLRVVVKDQGSGRMGSMACGLHVRHFSELLTSSSLILADSIEPLTARNECVFAVGGDEVLANPGQVFSRRQDLGAYLQVYNLRLDPNTHKPFVSIQYQILKDGKPILEEPEDAARLAQSSTVFTVAKSIPLRTLETGRYSLRIRITDNIGKASITPTTTFEIR